MTNRITGKLIPKDNRNVTIYADFFPNSDIGGGSGGSGTDYQSSGSIVKDMVEQGSNFNWAKYAIDIPSLPCFKPEAEWPEYTGESRSIATLLADGYAVVKAHIVKVTGENPDITFTDTGEPFFYQVGSYVDCEPVVVTDEMASIVPARFFSADMNTGYVGMPTERILSGDGYMDMNSWGAYPEVVDGVLKYVLAGQWSTFG